MPQVPMISTARVTLQCEALNINEILQYSFHVSLLAGADPAVTLALAQTWWDVILPGQFKERTNLQRVNISRLVGGNWNTEAELISSPPLPGSTNAPLPPQISSVVSLETTELGVLPGDSSRRNRFYVGYLGLNTTDQDGRLSATDQQLLLDSVVALHNNFIGRDPSEYIGNGGLLVTSVQENLSADVQSIRVGRVYDTQRRRRNNLTENYLIAAV